MSEHNDLRTHIRAEIRAEMARQNVSQRQLGEALGWPLSTTNRRLQRNEFFDVQDLVDISRFLKVTPADLGFPVLTTRGR